TYTDAAIGGLLLDVDSRFTSLNNELQRVGAMSAAFAAMSGNTAGQGSGAMNRVVVGVGGYGGETALSVGFSRTINSRTAFNLGFSTSSSGDSMGGGSFGFAW